MTVQSLANPVPRFEYFLFPMTGTPRKIPFKLVPIRPWWRKPFRYLLKVRPRPRHLHGSLVHKMLGSRIFETSLWVPDREALAKGVAVGMFIGMLPLIGLQILTSAIICYFLRANIAAAALATLVSNPFTAPGLIWAQLELGHWIAPAFVGMDNTHYEGTAKFLVAYGKPLLVGSLVSAAVCGILSYPLMHGLWALGERMVRRRKAARLMALRHHHHAHHYPHHHASPHPHQPGEGGQAG